MPPSLSCLKQIQCNQCLPLFIIIFLAYSTIESPSLENNKSKDIVFHFYDEMHISQQEAKPSCQRIAWTALTKHPKHPAG